MSHLDQKAVKNRILATLPAAEFALIGKNLSLTNMDLGQTLHRCGEKIDTIYFVESGFISALTVLSDGQPLEIGLIGAEGVAGVSVLLGAETSFTETMCQTGGAAYRISPAAFKGAAAECPHLRD